MFLSLLKIKKLILQGRIAGRRSLSLHVNLQVVDSPPTPRPKGPAKNSPRRRNLWKRGEESRNN